ncbi:TlpA disulfide reductase family protein [Shouchella shacheensis]|uniref:TlpA disulfide reductase family protein n=1 Tax=Shouchella shacheensis TaxID=1649580 RepID=UPI0007400C6B|nr:TlpA disulfide reductase family protein [Shouchella shacheensis]
MKKKYLLRLCLLTAIVLVGWFHLKTESIFRHVEVIADANLETASAQVGELAPGFTLSTLGGSTASLEAKEGRYTVLHFFATWCHPCQEEMPIIVEMAKRLETQGDQFIAVNLTSEDTGKAELRTFLKHYDATFDPALDKEGEVLDEYQIIGIPTTIVLDSQGEIIQRINGAMSPSMVEDLRPMRENAS